MHIEQKETRKRIMEWTVGKDWVRGDRRSASWLMMMRERREQIIENPLSPSLSLKAKDSISSSHSLIPSFLSCLCIILMERHHDSKTKGGFIIILFLMPSFLMLIFFIHLIHSRNLSAAHHDEDDVPSVTLEDRQLKERGWKQKEKGQSTIH